MTARFTWRRLAPSARRSASSRLRCATSMLNVLKMMKDPTKIEMTAKTSRKMLKKLSASLMSPESAAASWSPVSAS